MKLRTHPEHIGKPIPSYRNVAKLVLIALISASLTVVGSLQGEPASATNGLTYQAVAAGDRFSLALSSEGNLYSWGDNALGQLGDGTNNSRNLPGPVSTQDFGGLTFSAIAAGTDFAVAIRVDGTLFSWGYNNQGQLGVGSTTDKSSPTQVNTALTFSQVAAGGNFAVALTADGKAYAWGYNLHGQLGDNTTTRRTSPVEVQTALTFSHISAGLSHVLAISSDGRLYAWGQGTYGQLGFASGWVAGKLTPAPVATTLVGSRTFSAVAAGSIFSVALDSQGNAFSWGQNQFGQLGIGVFGDGTSATNKTVPVAVNTAKTFSAVVAGRWHTVAFDMAGELYAWGINANAQIGDGTTTNRHSPTASSKANSGSSKFTHLSAGPGVQANHTLALTDTGVLYAWGWNDYGQLGNGTQSGVLIPTAMPAYTPGPIAELGSTNSSVTTLSAVLMCVGSCGSGDSFSYSAILSGGSGPRTVVADSITSSVLLTFDNLDPNTLYTLETSVAFGGQVSATSSTTISTVKPSSTISAISVLDTSVTLTVGCTNCGASPDSFTVSATPVAGGAAITSNTNVISGLSPETTYSFSVVVAFAGTTSDVVLWQDNPVMTLPLVPVITAVSPAAVPLTGGTITVTGANFTTSTILTLGITSSAFTIVSGTEITFTAPFGTSGSFALAITNPVGTFTLPGAITYVSGPSLTTNSPVLATTNGGTIVTLTGTDLATTNQVNVGSTTVSFSVVSNTIVRFTTAATTAGVVDVGVVTVGGAATISGAIEFTTSALVPVISTITPVTGPTAGGTTITVTGQHFSGSYSNSVSAAINGISGSSVILIDDSTLTFVSPQGAAATGLDVTVATGGGVGTLAGAFTYTAPPAPTTPGSAPAVVINTPTIAEFSTREIPASGASVTATGLRLENVSVLTLGGITVTIVSNNATFLTFTTGEMPIGVWDLRLVGSNGTLVFQQAIEVVEASAIVAESTGELLGYTWTLKFLGNSRSLHDAQAAHLTRRLNPNAETIICWGYTTAANPNAWAISHATQRAQAACDFALATQSNVKTVVRLRYGVSKDYAMRSALQFWELKPAP